jgi:archaellum biogenesis ATPase FlaH/DNA-binding MarR family transcriptional regulator
LNSDSKQYRDAESQVNRLNKLVSEINRLRKQEKIAPQQTNPDNDIQAPLENQPSQASPDDQNNDDSQKIVHDNAPEVTKDSALQKSNTELIRPIDRNMLSFNERHETGRQQLNKQITKYAEDARRLSKKKKYEVEANVNRLFESIKQEMYKSEVELFGTLLSEVESHQIEWLWQGRIPLGKITILDGDPGIGKSLIAINIAACVSVGHPMPDGTTGIQGRVILIAPEDSPADTIKPRLEAIGGDPEQVLLLNTMERFDAKRMGIFNYPFSLSQDLQDLEKIIKRRKAKLVILDPLMAILGHEVSATNDQNIREVLTPLAQVAERTRCAILIIRHLNKGSSMNALYRGAGSIGIIGAARMGLIAVRDPNDEQMCILATSKNNLSKHANHLKYQIVENDQKIPYVQWLGETHETVSNLLRSPTNIPFEHQEIHRVLSQANGSLDPKDIAERTGQKIESVRVILSRMYERGEIARPSRGRYASLDHVTVTEIGPTLIAERSETSVRSDINVINDTNDTNPA